MIEMSLIVWMLSKQELFFVQKFMIQYVDVIEKLTLMIAMQKMMGFYYGLMEFVNRCLENIWKLLALLALLHH